MVQPARVFGAMTSAYGVSALWTAGPLTRHGELGDPRDPPPAARLLSATFGVRDLLSGLTIVAAPRGRPLQAALAARVVIDAGDALGFALLAPTARARVKLGLVAGVWAAVAAGVLAAELHSPDD